MMVAVAGMFMVAFAEDYAIPILDSLADGFWVNGFFGLGLIIIGTLITVIKR